MAVITFKHTATFKVYGIDFELPHIQWKVFVLHCLSIGTTLFAMYTQ